MCELADDDNDDDTEACEAMPSAAAADTTNAAAKFTVGKRAVWSVRDRTAKRRVKQNEKQLVGLN